MAVTLIRLLRLCLATLLVTELLFALVWPDLHPDLDQRLEVRMLLDRGLVPLLSVV